MKPLTILAIVVSNALFGALELSFSADRTANIGTKEPELSSQPVTNESVEDGLRKNREALRTSPEFQTNDAPTHQRLAEVLSQQGDPNGAIEEYQAALTLNPSLIKAYRGLGAVYIDKHEWQKAQQALQKWEQTFQAMASARLQLRPLLLRHQ